MNHDSFGSRRRKTTRNPDGKRGRPILNYDRDTSIGKPVSAAEMDTIDDAVADFWSAQYGQDARNVHSAWEVDPLLTAAQKTDRDQALALLNFDQLSLTDQYIAYRNVTEALVV